MSERPLRYEVLTEQQALLAEISASVLASRRDDPMAGADLGWFGIGADGSGSAEDLAVVVEAAGAATSSSLAGWQAGVVIPVLSSGGPDAEPLVARLATGDAVAALATCDPGRLARSLVGRSMERLSGSFLAFGTEATTHVLVPVSQDGAAERVAVVPVGAPGLRLESLESIDVTRPFVRVTLDEVGIGSAELVVTGPDLFDSWLARANLIAALDASGAAREALGLTLGYARQRQQFGRLIGSYQAYKHRCATMFVKLKMSQSLGFGAARAIDTADGPDLALSAGMLATRSATFVAGEAVQLHGGIGFTWDAGLHRLLKRARTDEIVAYADGAGPRQLLARFRAGRQQINPLDASPTAITAV